MSHTKKLWPGLTANVGSGNVKNVGNSTLEVNCMETTSNPSLIQAPDSRTGTHIWHDSSLDKSNPFVSPVTKPSQNEKTVSVEHTVPCPESDTCKTCEKFCGDVLEKLDHKSEVLKIGDKVWYKGHKFPQHHGRIGTIKDIPNPVIAWVQFNRFDEEHGFNLTELELIVEPKPFPELNNDVGTMISAKKDDGKYDPSMLTLEMVELVSKVRMFGAKKYARNNFKITGFKYTRSLAAALRHIFAFLNGEDNDPESGLSHLGHAICSLEHCIYDTKNHPENDDRKS